MKPPVFPASPHFSNLDRYFGQFIEDQSGGNNQNLALAAALVSRQRSLGHVCLDLAQLAGRPLESSSEPLPSILCPPFESWIQELRASPVVGKPGQFRPLILDQRGRLYLHKYWSYEKQLGEAIRSRATSRAIECNETLLQEGLHRLFPQANRNQIDWQKAAVFMAVQKQLTIISGGPGTGKTHTVAFLLALLIEQAEGRNFRIALAAPTGKAAARLQESIRTLKPGLNCSEAIKERIPEDATTVHRLLGSIHGSVFFRFNEKNPMPFDLVVVDEASMVDLALMAKLLAALSASARLVLLGDKDQLSSIEAGGVFSDLCHAAPMNQFSLEFCQKYEVLNGEQLPPRTSPQTPVSLSDCRVQLERNFRFASTSGIHLFSSMIRRGNLAEGLETLKSPSSFEDLQWRALPAPAELKDHLRSSVIPEYLKLMQVADAEVALRELHRFRILCAVRQGPFGVENINRLCEEILFQDGMIPREEKHYHGRPIMISRNDYDSKLFNGDVGIIMKRPGAEESWAFFESSDGTPRKFSSWRLPPHETVYAMTVHKSQGSEFKKVLFILPAQSSAVLSRELIYTGVTRASERVELWSSEEILLEAIGRQTSRTSGLRDRLMEQNPPAFSPEVKAVADEER